MLKWTVGQQRRVDSTTGCCKPPFRKPKRRSTGKENARERRSSDSPRTRDSVYMRLDAVPMALRDVSNYRLDETPPRTPEVRRTGVKRKSAARSPERRKQPCVERHLGLADGECQGGILMADDLECQGRILADDRLPGLHLPGLYRPGLADQCTGWMSASKYSLDSARSTLQIEYSPFPLRAAQSLMAVSSESPPSSLYYMNQSPSPIELDHKEIPLRPDLKASILSTPLNPKIRQEIARRLCSPSELSPLASKFNFLRLNTRCDNQISDLHISPIDLNIFREREIITDNKDSCKLARNCVSLNDVNSPVCANYISLDNQENSTRICSQTNNDRDDSVNNNKPVEIEVKKCDEIVENLVNRNESERDSSSFATSIDINEPSLLRRQRVIRRSRRRGWEGALDGEKARKIARSCLTLPDGIPSPFESPAVMGRLRRPAISLLTLPRGIPSPPSPILADRQADKEPLAEPLADSPKPPTPPTPDSLHTWDSHNLHFLKTPRLTAAHILNDATLTEPSETGSPISSKLDESDEDGISSLGSVSLSEQSPLAVVEGQSRSRRCLTFTSPRKKVRRSMIGKSQGELELSIRYTAGFLTINVIRGKNLQPPSGFGTCNAYIKVSVVPSATERTFHRTCVRKDSSNPRFDTKFTLEVTEEDLERRVLVSAWHRDRRNRKSEFLGCMSFGVKHAVKREISGSFRLLSQGSGRLKNVPTMTNSENLWYQQTEVMANQSESSVEELVSVDDSDVCQSIDISKDRRRKSVKKEMERVHEDQIFLRHLELDPPEESETASPKPGQTPFTTTRTLAKQSGGSFGFSIAWTHPPRVERVESGLPADQAGLRPGDYVIFVGDTNVVTLQEDEILQQIKNGGNHVVLEVYRKQGGGGGGGGGGGSSTGPAKSLSHQPRSSTACSATTTATATASLEITKRRLHLPQVTFNSEVGTGIIV